MSNERDELAEVIRAIDGPASLGGLDIADAILAAGYVKAPATETEWGVGSKWGRHPFLTQADAEQNIALHHKCGEHARLVKRPAGTKPGQWEEAE